MWHASYVERNIARSRGFDKLLSCIRGFDGISCMQETEILMFHQMEVKTMTNFHHPAVYARMLWARKKLAEALDRHEKKDAEKISALIDRMQLERWKAECLKNVS